MEEGEERWPGENEMHSMGTTLCRAVDISHSVIAMAASEEDGGCQQFHKLRETDRRSFIGRVLRRKRTSHSFVYVHLEITATPADKDAGVSEKAVKKGFAAEWGPR